MKKPLIVIGKVVGICLGILATVAANAGSISNVVITGVMAERGAFFVSFGSTITGRPACATNQTRFAVDPDDPGGRAMIATILSAWAAGRTVGVDGTNSCDIWADTESVNYIYAI